jgi:hypothetical protein
MLLGRRVDGLDHWYAANHERKANTQNVAALQVFWPSDDTPPVVTD